MKTRSHRANALLARFLRTIGCTTDILTWITGRCQNRLGNFFTIREVAEKFGYEPIRFMMLQAHYRSPINYSLEIIEQCKSALERLYNCKELLATRQEYGAGTATYEDEKATLLRYKEKFIASMDDDLNTADAIAAVFELVREINSHVV